MRALQKKNLFSPQKLAPKNAQKNIPCHLKGIVSHFCKSPIGMRGPRGESPAWNFRPRQATFKTARPQTVCGGLNPVAACASQTRARPFLKKANETRLHFNAVLLV